MLFIHLVTVLALLHQFMVNMLHLILLLGFFATVLPLLVPFIAWVITEGAQHLSPWFDQRTGFAKSLTAFLLVAVANLLTKATGHEIPADLAGWTNEIATWIAQWLATQGGHLLKTKVAA
jgi:hypothetical protein